MIDTKIKRILFIGCNYDQLPYLTELKLRGYFVVGIDKNPNAPGRSLCDVFYEIGYDEIDEMIRIGQQNKFVSEDKIFTAAAQFAHKSAASFAAYFGCTYPKIEDIKSCLDKVAYYKKFPEISIPIPLTKFVQSQDELKSALKKFNPDAFCYLKSDYSKNPKYVYRFKVSAYEDQEIFWGRDIYLREYYILQEEVLGPSLRINLYGDRFNIYDFHTGLKTDAFNSVVESLEVINALQKIRTYYGMNRWLIKFDVIINDVGFVVLDIGMDPPSRMKKTSDENGVNFAEHYLNQYLYGVISYPLILD
jgi:hypothetical protein